MARRKTRLERILDVKPAAYAGLRALTLPFPLARRLLSFFPDIRPLPDRIVSVSENSCHRIRLAQTAHQEALRAFEIDNWDVHRSSIMDQDPFTTKRFIGLVEDVFVPGHTLTAVDPVSWQQIGFERNGRTNWNIAHPGLSSWRSRHVEGTAVVIEPHANYYHLLIEKIFPFIRALQLSAWGDAPLTIITRKRRPTMLDVTVAAVRAQGVDVSLLDAEPSEHFSVDRLLVAVEQNWNVERSYSLAPIAEPVRDMFVGQHGGAQSVLSRRLYLTRRGSKLRNILNEGPLIEELKRLDFEVLQATWDNHAEQIAAFSQAEVIVAVHGAGLANLVFAQPGARLLEIFPTDFRKTTYLHLAAEHRLEYHSFFGTREGRNQEFSVNIPELMSMIRGIL